MMPDNIPEITPLSTPSSPVAPAEGAPRPTLPERARTAGAVVAGRAAGALSRRLRRGGGTSIAGLVAQRVDADVTMHLAQQLRHGSAVVTGTNGKTTTSGMLASSLRAAGVRVWRNREGANLARGISAALVIRARPDGRLRWNGNAAAVFEVDEAAFTQIVAEVRPRVIMVTNLFRDQLDRYGEVDTVLERWRGALARLPVSTALVLNADDPAVASLALGLPAEMSVYYFGVEDAPQPSDAAAAPPVEVVDTRTCPRCGATLEFAPRFYSHIGHWRCPACGLARPRPQVAARDVAPEGAEAVRFTLAAPDATAGVRIGLPGLYNVYNAVAAAAAALAMGGRTAASVVALGSFRPAFGRGERILVGERAVHLLLAKNPTGLNEVLRALQTASGRHHLLLLLNDRPADGADVSWIWDADFERVAALAERVTVGGTRAYDLALRLKYAEAPVALVTPEIPAALDAALHAAPAGGTLYVVPTYTALLEVRGVLERRGHVRHYWE
jgi:lipid II isoglutaminyl synthase (glutamine-hydrolysing)